jgi:hypothetical protein
MNLATRTIKVKLNASGTVLSLQEEQHGDHLQCKDLVSHRGVQLSNSFHQAAGSGEIEGNQDQIILDLIRKFIIKILSNIEDTLPVEAVPNIHELHCAESNYKF